MNRLGRTIHYIRMGGLAGCAFVALAACQSTAPTAIADGPPGAMSPELFAEMQAAQARNNAMPDTPGTGPYPALKEEVTSLADHVIYRPSDLAGVQAGALGIVAWGNGGCSDDGASARQHLAQIASYGYLVIASGTVKSGPEFPAPAMDGPPPIGPDGERILPPPLTNPDQLVEAIDWALAQNADPQSPYFGKIDPQAIAVSGWSCGGLQAITVGSSDPRVKTLLIHNSGIFNAPFPGRDSQPGKDALGHLKGTILYILGGPQDIAFENGMDDYERITNVPVALADLDVGHGGTFYQPNGGAVTPVAIAWLDWQLKGNEQAAQLFTGPDCGLCNDEEWALKSKNF